MCIHVCGQVLTAGLGMLGHAVYEALSTGRDAELLKDAESPWRPGMETNYRIIG